MTSRVVGFAQSNHRRNQRILIPSIHILVEGRLYRTTDWSLGGFLIEGYDGNLHRGESFKVIAAGAFDDDLSVLGATARVVRLEAGGMRLAAQYLELPDRAFDVLQSLMMRRHPAPVHAYTPRVRF